MPLWSSNASIHQECTRIHQAQIRWQVAAAAFMAVSSIWDSITVSILGTCFIGIPGIELASSSFWITRSTWDPVSLSENAMPATSSMKASSKRVSGARSRLSRLKATIEVCELRWIRDITVQRETVEVPADCSDTGADGLGTASSACEACRHRSSCERYVDRLGASVIVESQRSAILHQNPPEVRYQLAAVTLMTISPACTRNMNPQPHMARFINCRCTRNRNSMTTRQFCRGSHRQYFSVAPVTVNP